MHLKPIFTGKWNIFAYQSDRGDCPLLDFLTGLDGSFHTHRDSMLALLEEVGKRSETPDQWLPSQKCHTITNDNKIWQFTVGRLRVAWFFDEGRIIICTHGFIKCTQATKKKDQNFSQKTRTQYFDDKQLHNIVVEEEEH